MKVDMARIRDRRLELGMGRRELGRQLGESTVFIRSLEHGMNHDILTVANLSGLATLLGISVGALFREPAASETNHSEDADRLIALLIAAGDRWGPIAALARRLNLSVSETDSLAACSKESLSDVGLDLLRSTNGLDLRLSYDTGVASRQQLAQIQRDVNARSDIEEHAAQLVYRVITRTVTARTINASPTGRLLIGRAVNAGWTKAPVNEKDNLELADKVRESLRLN